MGKLTFYLQRNFNILTSPGITNWHSTRVVLYNGIVPRDCRDYQGKGLAEQTPVICFSCYVLTAVCLWCVFFFVYLFVKNLMAGYDKPLPAFQHSPLIVTQSSLVPLNESDATQKQKQNKPTGIIISSLCNHHSRLIRPKMKTSTRESVCCCLKCARENKSRDKLIHMVATDRQARHGRWDTTLSVLSYSVQSSALLQTTSRQLADSAKSLILFI